MLMIYLHITISIWANIRIQEAEPTVAQSSTGILVATSSPSDDHPPHAKKITEAFDIRYPNLPVVEVRPRVQVPLPGTYQVHAPPQTCRDILRVMSIQKKSENEERENKKRMAEKVVAEKKTALKINVVVVHVVVQEKKNRRMAWPEIVSPVRAVQHLRKQRGF